MEINNTIYKLRVEAKLTQGQFAEIMGVTQQSVQKWESGSVAPSIDKLIQISNYFDISLDSLILGKDNRVVEEMEKSKKLIPEYQNLHDWEFYSSNLSLEYVQSIEEGLDIESYKDLFSSVSRLQKGEIKKRLGDVLFDIILNAKERADYKYYEPSSLETIQSTRRGTETPIKYDEKTLKEKIYGAWMGRICGCMLGKPLEGIKSNELTTFLKETDNYPMHRYVYRTDLKPEIIDKLGFGFRGREYADEINGMPVDDDTNYVVLAQELIEKYGKEFTPNEVGKVWLNYQSKNAYCTAERVAYCNFIKGYSAPQTAIYKNPYREWIGAQIRGDYFGYINPGNPKKASEMAWRDASISHVKNGIYGEMFVSAMVALAFTTNDIESIIRGGLDEIPATSRLYESVNLIIDCCGSGKTFSEAIKLVTDRYDEYSSHGWCHTISNAMIVVASLLYGKGDFAKSICLSVQVGFDTDCNGATVGSILGAMGGIKCIPEYWQKPINNKLHTSIFGVGTVNIKDCVEKTIKHIKG